MILLIWKVPYETPAIVECKDTIEARAQVQLWKEDMAWEEGTVEVYSAEKLDMEMTLGIKKS